jgi:hypothetical protein
LLETTAQTKELVGLHTTSKGSHERQWHLLETTAQTKELVRQGFFFLTDMQNFAQKTKHRFRVCKPNLSNNQAAEKIFHSSKMPALWE